jgi:ferrous iron transport protein A
MENKKRLSDMSVGECGRISRLLTEGSMRRRFLDVGLAPGTVVTCVGRSPLGDPSAYLVRGCKIAIRRSDASGIILE